MKEYDDRKPIAATIFTLSCIFLAVYAFSYGKDHSEKKWSIQEMSAIPITVNHTASNKKIIKDIRVINKNIKTEIEESNRQLFRINVASYKKVSYAKKMSFKLEQLGYKPLLSQNRNYYQVSLRNIDEKDVASISKKLNSKFSIKVQKISQKYHIK